VRHAKGYARTYRGCLVVKDFKEIKEVACCKELLRRRPGDEPTDIRPGSIEESDGERGIPTARSLSVFRVCIIEDPEGERFDIRRCSSITIDLLNILELIFQLRRIKR
jgi:hypothetical protein